MRLCRACEGHLAETAERRDEDIHAERVLMPVAIQAGDVLGGPLTVLAVETLPNSFVVRLHHDIDWVVPGVCEAEPRGGSGRAHPTTWGRWEMADDRGGTYTGCVLGGHASPEGWWGELYLHPALDRTSRQLDLRLIAAGQQLIEIGVSLT
jgi:hypothetical protein